MHLSFFSDLFVCSCSLGWCPLCSVLEACYNSSCCWY